MWQIIDPYKSTLKQGEANQLVMEAFDLIWDGVFVHIKAEHAFGLVRYVLLSTKGCLIVQPAEWEE